MIDDLDIPGATVFLLDYPGESRFEELKAETPWAQRSMILYGKSVRQPRFTCWYGDPGASYGYSGLAHDPLPWTPTLLEIKEKVEGLLLTEFNGLLLNYYRDGRDSISFHSDSEKELGPEPIIASVSFGAPRVFTLRHKRGEEADVHLKLDDCSLLVMAGETQKNWNHGIQKVKDAGPRINLTFRRIISP